MMDCSHYFCSLFGQVPSLDGVIQNSTAKRRELILGKPKYFHTNICPETFIVRVMPSELFRPDSYEYSKILY